jgi:excisionase family DNA binding protein
VAPEKSEKEFFSFEEALRELRLKEEELKRLVSEGEIRAFRDGATMKLRKADVENLRNELSGGEVVEVGNTAEELVFEDDTELQAGMATAEISGADTLVEEVEEIAPNTRAAAKAGAAGAVAGAKSAGRAVSRRAAPAASMAAVEGTENLGLRAALILTSLVLVLAVPVCMSVASGTVSGMAKGIASIFAKFS